MEGKKKPSALPYIVLLLVVGIAAYAGGMIVPFPSLPTMVAEKLFFLSPDADKPLFTGTLTRIFFDLEIFKKDEASEPDMWVPSTSYFFAGTYAKGPYRGYERILAVQEAMGPGPASVFILATRDRDTFILDDPDQTATKYPKTDWRNPFMTLDEKKIAKTGILPTDHPKTILLNSAFALYRDYIPTTGIETGEKDASGYPDYETIIDPTVSSYTPLDAPLLKSLSLFGYTYAYDGDISSATSDVQEKELLRRRYISGTTGVVAIDSTGLPMTYILTRDQTVRQYEKDMQSYEKKWEIYDREMNKFDAKEISEAPEYPMMPESPNLRFSAADVSGISDIFSSYDIAIPSICGMDVNFPVINNITDDDLVSAGSVFGVELFTLKDTQHPLYTLAYENKMLMPKEEFENVNAGLSIVTKEEYVAQHPLFFFKDYWGRWVASGEYVYKMLGGCGKPVVYLYPEESTDVRIVFTEPMALTKTIPSYAGGWIVRADPDGVIHDRTGRTDCEAIDASAKGSEYALSACANNAYPYLYWAGNRIGQTLPVGLDAFIVENNDLSNFLSTTLTDIGFSPSERDDFLSYWVSELKNTEAPWYRIRFLGTGEMNTVVPMDIDPKPDTVYRLFMDWMPLQKKPSIMPVAQHLAPMVRDGFTVLEWGGLRRGL